MAAAVLRTRSGLGRATGVLLLLVLFFLGLCIRPITVRTEQKTIILLGWAWQQGRIDFTNSITNRPVAISFAMPWHFSGFFARTDPGTEEYYTAGLFSWNEELAKESTRTIRYCSEVGVDIHFGKTAIHTEGGCIEATLRWPPL